jgi:nickel/cobalt transporter (NicO) family protein
MKTIRICAASLLAVLVSLVVVPVAFAHPLGNFTINHYAGIHVSRDRITIDFVMDMAEIPAFQEISTFDDNGNGIPDPQKTAQYHPAKCAALGAQLDLDVNGKPLALHLDSSEIAFPPGAGGLSTLRLTCEFSTPVSLTDQKAQLSFADISYADRIGWREIVVTSDGVGLQGSHTSTSISQRLAAYPKDMLADPLNQRQLNIVLLSAPGSVSTSPAASPALQGSSILSLGSTSLSRTNDAFTQLITLQNITPLGFLLSLLIAFVWGGLHAVTPGHGKTIVGAYLVGSRGTARHALFLGLTTTITHTAGVFALGLITLFAARFVVPEKLYPWLSLASGVLVAIIGFWMVFVRARGAQLSPKTIFEQIGHAHADTVHHAHAYHDDHTRGHSHAGHSHSHGDHQHLHVLAYDHDHSHEGLHVARAHGQDDHSHDDHAHEHAHGGYVHTHLPPGARGEAVTWRSILALGISGGILPCPSALIVLLSAIALGRVAFGLALVLAFSAGLAGVLSGIGILFVYAGRLFEFSPRQGILLRLMPLGSALVIAGAGLFVAIQALSQIGFLRL